MDKLRLRVRTIAENIPGRAAYSDSKLASKIARDGVEHHALAVQKRVRDVACGKGSVLHTIIHATGSAAA